ncbi:MAG: FAD-dependent oxidoreductase [Clostridiales bacterium]|nr:FAD-dependent oxidoreductase [Clostridiales bacterium]
MYDLVIIGSGPAGLSAAVYAKRAMLDVVVLEKEAFSGGQIVNTEQVDNYLGLPGTNGYDLAMKFKEHADALEVPFKEGDVTAIADQGDYRTVELEDGEILETKTILIATGAKHKHLGADGEEELMGAGVSYCATCDGAFFRNKDVVVVGGGDVALGDALYLAKGCRKVYLVHRRDGFRAAKVLQEKVEQTGNIEFLPFYEVAGIHGEGMVSSVTLLQNQTKEEKELEVSGIFVAVGMEPETGFAKGVVDMDQAGYIVADETGVTSTKGIFVAGDVRTKALRQVATAVSDGANAITSIEKFLE